MLRIRYSDERLADTIIEYIECLRSTDIVNMRNNVATIVEVTASGKELKQIIQQWNKIPYPNGILLNNNVSVTWFGDIAKMLIYNIEYIQ